jgi:hypothetical protein
MDMITMWWLSLGFAAIVVVVVAVLLGLIIATAKRIDAHAASIWTAGKQIAGNTVAIWMLEQTNEHLIAINEAAKAIEQGAGAIDQKLRALAAPRG